MLPDRIVNATNGEAELFEGILKTNRIREQRGTHNVRPIYGDGWFGSVVVSWPVSPDRFSLTARAGLFGWESDIDVRVISGGTGSVSDRDSGTDMLYGVGVEWHLNEQWSMTADWERYELTDWVDVPSIGVKIRF